MKKIILNLVILIVIFTPLQLVSAKTVANIISIKGEFLVIDLSTNKKIMDGKLVGITAIDNLSPGDVVGDATHNRLLVVDNSHNRIKIFVYDLRTLKQLKILDLISDYGEDDDAVKVFVASPLTTFYVKWWNAAINNGNGSQLLSTYNLKTLEKIKDYNLISLAEKILVSNDASKIYSISDQETTAQIDVFNSDTFEKIQSINLEDIISPGIFGRGVDDFKNNKILIVENIKKNKIDRDNYKFYTFDINLKKVSAAITTNLEGSSFLLSDGNKVVFSEEKDISSTSLGEIISLGKIHIYDLNLSKQVGEITLGSDPIGRILGTSSDGKKLVYYSSQFNGSNSKITIIDLTNYSILAQIPAPINSAFMTLYVE